MTLERVIFSGYGGQGLMFIGKLFANMMLNKVAHVTFFPSYGAEVRGGTSNCQIILSSQEIASPVVETADSLILMNQSSVDRFLPCMADTGTALINSAMAVTPDRPNVYGIPATDIAQEAGDIRSANVVMLGAYLYRKELATLDEARKCIIAASAVKGRKFQEINATALAKGWAFADGATP